MICSFYHLPYFLFYSGFHLLHALMNLLLFTHFYRNFLPNYLYCMLERGVFTAFGEDFIKLGKSKLKCY